MSLLERIKRSPARKRPVGDLERVHQRDNGLDFIFRVASSTVFRPFVHRISTRR